MYMYVYVCICMYICMYMCMYMYVFLTLRDPPRPGPAHPREHGDSAAPKSLDPKFRVQGSGFMAYGLGFRVEG